jgi:hypothetical protein
MTLHHPNWCAQGHHCNHHEHRSEPNRWQTPYGTVVAAITQCVGSRKGYLDLHIRVGIDANQHAARRQAAALAVAIDDTIRTALAANTTPRIHSGRSR